MRVKWLIILSVIFVGVILIGLLATQQNSGTTLLPKEDAQKNAQSTDYTQLQPLPMAITSTPRSLVKSGITIIKAPSREPKNKVPPVLVEKSIETATNTSSEDRLPNTITQGDTQTGITKIGKHPSLKEAKEMNSAGRVMY